jgi:amino acid adenylation domain-containing protein
LIRIDAEEHLLVQVFHHIVSDGWSMRILFRELTTLYGAFEAGRPSPLAELPTSYAAYAVAQRSTHAEATLERDLAYWRAQLEDAPDVLELPLDRRRAAHQTYEGARVAFTLDGALIEALTDLSRRERVSMFMTLLAAFKALLWRHTAQTDLVVGTPSAGRSAVELEGLIGCFANTLALRTDLSGDPTFQELLRRVRAAALGAYAHQDLPFARLVEELQPERSLSHTPLVQVLFNFRDFPRRVAETAGLTIEDHELELGLVMTDLEVVFVRDSAGLTCRILGNVGLFDRSTLERLAEHYRRILWSAVEDPTRRLSALVAPAGPERRQVTVEWNDTRTRGPSHPCAHDWFEAQAAATPDRLAVVGGGTRLTYRELDQHSGRLARYLQRRGVGPEVTVGICLDRTPTLLVAVLGVLRAGGAYLPLDPGHPQDRLRYLIEDGTPAIVLTESHLLEVLPDLGHAVVCLDREADAIGREPAAPSPATIGPEHPAYLIYTSGSTGRPKGVMVPHRALVNFLDAMRRRPGVGADDVLLAVTTLSFDIAGLELLLPLTAGAQVILASGEEAADGELLADLVARSGATIMQATPSTWRMLLDAGWTGSACLTALCGGEALPAGLASALQSRCAALWNLYGPTETTIWSTVHSVAGAGVEPGEASAADPMPIGRPIDNTQVYVLDHSLEPLPVGVPGELCIGGLGVARGYFGRPGLTAERFVPDPFSTVPGSRLYRTGDRVRWRADGTLLFLGRVDRQVKIRGHRIEPGEIEAALAAHPAVHACAVVVLEDAPGEGRLVGYVVPVEPVAPSTRELRSFLKQRLPEYMVPATFLALAALPLTANGKLDRRSLPRPGTARPELAEQYVAPRTRTEQVMADLWAGVLRVDRIGMEDNFFELGGHSLLATQVVARTRATLGVALPLRAVFEDPTVAGLAARVDQLLTHSAPDTVERLLAELDQLSEEEAARLLQSERESATMESAPIELSPVAEPADGGTAVLSFAQQRMWFYNQLEPGSYAYNQVRATRWRGRLNVAVLTRCLTELAHRHEVLRGRVALAASGPEFRAEGADPLALTVEDFTSFPAPAREAAAREWLVAEGRRPFDLASQVPTRAFLLRLAPDDHVLGLVIHHIAFDRWSSAVLSHELTALYSAYAAGSPAPLPDPPLQYRDFARWQRERVDSGALERELAFWTERLRDLPAVLQLPIDRPRPEVQTHKGDCVAVALSPDLTGKLEFFSRAEGASLFMTVLAAFQALLWDRTGQTDLPLGVVVAGRNRVEFERLIGCFTNTLVLRANLSADPSLRDVLARAREVALAAFAHQDLPFEKLVEELRPERSVGHHPLFQVLLNYLDIPAARTRVPGLRIEDFEVSLGTAFVDLALDVKRKGNGFTCHFTYNTDLFDRSSVEQLASDYIRLLETMASDPERRLSAVPQLLRPHRRPQLAGSGLEGNAGQ